MKSYKNTTQYFHSPNGSYPLVQFARSGDSFVLKNSIEHSFVFLSVYYIESECIEKWQFEQCSNYDTKYDLMSYSDKSYLVANWDGYVKSTFNSTISDVPMRPVSEDQRQRRRFTVKTVRNFRNGNYSFEFCPLHAVHALKSSSEK